MNTTTIDVHTHPMPDTYLAAVKKKGITEKDIGFPLFPWTVESRLADMDKYGVQAEVLSLSSPGLRFWHGQEAVDLGRQLNDELADIMRAHPTRFGGYATLPLPDVDAALDEIAYGFDVLHMDGVVLMTNYEGHYLGDPLFAPVMDELNRRQAVVFVHPTESPCIERLNFGYPAPMIEYPFDSTRMVISLLDTDTITRCPDIRFIVSHGGGTLPLLAPRIGELFSWKRHLDPVATAKKLKEQIATLYFDLAIVCYPSALAAIKESHDPAKLMMGFDAPFLPADSIGKAKQNFTDFPGFTEEQRGMIDADTARTLFPRLAKLL